MQWHKKYGVVSDRAFVIPAAWYGSTVSYSVVNFVRFR